MKFNLSFICLYLLSCFCIFIQGLSIIQVEDINQHLESFVEYQVSHHESLDDLDQHSHIHKHSEDGDEHEHHHNHINVNPIDYKFYTTSYKLDKNIIEYEISIIWPEKLLYSNVYPKALFRPPILASV